jgi:hypothetical protein
MILSFRPVGKTFSTEETLLIDCPDLFFVSARIWLQTYIPKFRAGGKKIIPP